MSHLGVEGVGDTAGAHKSGVNIAEGEGSTGAGQVSAQVGSQALPLIS